MEIELFRHPGYLGRAVALDIFVNGQRVASIHSGTSQKIVLPNGDVTLAVEMQGGISSPAINISSDCDGQTFECGTRLWVIFDFFSLCYLPFLKQRAFFLRAMPSNVPNA